MTNLAGYWSLDDSRGSLAGDGSRNGSTGTLVNSPTWTTGRMGSALSFNGANQYVNLGNPAALQITGNLTVSAWIYPTSLNANANLNTIISGRSTEVNQAYSLNVSPTVIQFSMNTTTGWSTTTAAATIPNNKWSHVMVTRSGTTLTFYLNGTSIGTASFTGTPNLGNGYFIGSGFYGGQNYYAGMIDDVRIYSRALGATEAAALGVVGTAVLGANLASGPLSANLAAYWNFDGRSVSGAVPFDRNGLLAWLKADESSGTVLRDSSGAGADGDISGGGFSFIGGKYGNGVRSTGASIGRIPGNALPTTTGTAMTYAFWYRLNGTPGAWAGFGNKMNYNVAGWSINRNNGQDQLYMRIDTSAGANQATDAYPVTGVLDGNWHHVAFTLSSGTVKGYKDGALVVNRPYNHGGGFANGNNLEISPTTPGDWDDVRYYGRALSDSEVNALYMNSPYAANPTVADVSGNGRTGTLIDGASTGAGISGQGIALDGLNDAMQVASTASLKYTGGNMTIAAWVYPNTTETTGGYIVSKPWNGTGQYNYYVVYTNGGATYLQLFGNTWWQSSAFTVTPGAWHHVVATVASDRTVKVYVDGVLILTQTHSLTNWTPGAGDINLPLSIGTIYPYGPGWNAGDVSHAFDGKVDNVRIYTAVLSDADVKTLYGYERPLSVGARAANPLSDGLVGYWSFNGPDMSGTTAIDRSGNGKNGTLTNGPTRTIGKTGQALSFNGSNQYVGMPTISIATNITASAWVYYTNAAQNGFIVGKNPVNAQWELFLEGGVLRWRDGAGGNVINSCAAPAANAWHHVVATQAGTTQTMYIDGVQCGTGTGSTIGNGTDTVDIGRFNGGYYFNGKIDEVRLYNRALSAQEVAALYNYGR